MWVMTRAKILVLTFETLLAPPHSLGATTGNVVMTSRLGELALGCTWPRYHLPLPPVPVTIGLECQLSSPIALNHVVGDSLTTYLGILLLHRTLP
jgi:hypothetical protein